MEAEEGTPAGRLRANEKKAMSAVIANVGTALFVSAFGRWFRRLQPLSGARHRPASSRPAADDPELLLRTMNAG